MSAFSERLSGLRWRLRASRRLWSRGAEPGDTFLSPEREEIQPMGEIDIPGPGAEVTGPVFTVRGWALFPGSATVRVEIVIDGAVVDNARLAHLRPDVAQGWDIPEALSSGFELNLERDVTPLPEGPVTVEAVAWSLAGDRQELGPVEVTIGSKEAQDPVAAEGTVPLPPPPFPTPRPPAKAGPSVLVYTHHLGLGGGQLYLLDLVRGLTAADAGSFTLVSALDGRLREDFEAMGVPVHIHGVLHNDFGSHVGRLEELVSWSQGRDFDVALLNTATVLALPGAELAQALGIPYVWAIHESFHPNVLWSVLSREMREIAEAALANADALVFEADATRRLFEAEAGNARCLTLPYGLDIASLDAERAAFDGPRAREAAAIPADAELIVCIGTIEPRKAQNTLAQAFDLIAAAHPRAHLAFVGGREDAECEALEELIATRGASGERMHVIPITPDIHDWYGMGDILVCASDIESLPRTVLEAMAWETPVLATNVFGIPELITDGENGWLCEPNDLQALADGLERALSSSAEERRRIGKRSRGLVEDRHSLRRYVHAISDLMQEVIAPNKRSTEEAEAG
ncbi:MAG: glycosyltransferase family 4 protein [Nitrososphaerota archaeon]